MERRKFITMLAGCTAALSTIQFDSLLAATGYHGDGPYNGPLLSNYVSSTCGACPGGCGIRVRRVDGIPVAIEGNPVHPINRGGLCPVGAAAMALLIHPDRVRQPLMRSGPRGSGQFKPVSWDAAEQLLQEKLSELRASSATEQLLFLDSHEKGPGADIVRKFMADFSSPNLYQAYDPNAQVCTAVWGNESKEVTYDLENARLILCFGHPVFEGGRNPVYFAGLRNRLLNAEEAKGRFIVVDPRLSASAAKAERWVPVKSGTHGLLALGLSYLLIKEQLYDAAFVSQFCTGFEDETDRGGNVVEGFKDFVLRNYYPGFVSEQTGVPLDQIISIARMFATTPGAVAIPGKGVTETVDGVYQSWAVMALNVLTGRMGKRGGIGPALEYPFRVLASAASKAPPLAFASTEQFPFLAGRGAMESLPERILAGTPYRIRVAILSNVNPVYDSPQANRFRQALQNIPFSVAITCIQNETSLLADLVLPDCTFLERHDLVIPSSDFSRPVVGVTQPAVPPLYDSRQSEDVILALAKRLFSGDWSGWDDYQAYLKDRAGDLFQSNVGALFSDQFTISFESLLAERGWRRKGYTSLDEFWEQLRVTGGWWDPTQPPVTEAGYVPTTAGKFFFSSQQIGTRFAGAPGQLNRVLASAALKPGGNRGSLLGSYRNSEDQTLPADDLRLHLIELTTSRGAGARMAKMADMVGYYQNIKWQCWVELSPVTAAELNLRSGQKVWVESPYGKKQMPLVIDPGLVPGTAAVPSGLGHTGSTSFGENIYDILAPARDCFTGAPAVAETKVRVYAAV